MKVFVDPQITQVFAALEELERKTENHVDRHCGFYGDMKRIIKEIREIMLSAEEVKVEVHIP